MTNEFVEHWYFIVQYMYSVLSWLINDYVLNDIPIHVFHNFVDGKHKLVR